MNSVDTVLFYAAGGIIFAALQVARSPQRWILPVLTALGATVVIASVVTTNNQPNTLFIGSGLLLALALAVSWRRSRNLA